RPGESMPKQLKRRYGFGHLHFITFSCYRRLPFLNAAAARDTFLRILNDIRNRYDFALLGYVVMPEHVHLLIGEPRIGDPSVVIKILKQRVSRTLRKRRRKRTSPGQLRLWDESPAAKHPRFWQRRFYDFNVWSTRKKNEKLNYIHFNPVKRELVSHPKDWRWSTYLSYWRGERGLCPPDLASMTQKAHATRQNPSPANFNRSAR